MEAIGRSSALQALRIAVRGFDPAGAAVWLVPVVLIPYLALHNGGFGPVERAEVGIAVWWIVLVGTIVGALPAAGGTRAGWWLFALLTAFAAFNALSLAWTESSERTVTELARVTTYLGGFALALAVQAEGRWRHLLSGVTVALAAMLLLALLSRFEPSWFPERRSNEFLEPGIERRLAYPLNYSSGLGTMAAMALPLLLGAEIGRAYV